jgi:integrase
MMVERGKLWSEVCSFYGQALAPNTQQQYGNHVQWFAAFCVANGADFLKPTEADVMMYCAFQAREVKYTTVAQYLKGLKSFYAQRRLPGIKSAEEWPHLYRMLKGIRRVKGGGTAPKAPITPAMLVAFRKNMDVSSSYGAALWACVLVTFFGFFRKSNTTANPSSLHSTKLLLAGDIEVDTKRYCLKVKVRATKTIQFAERALVVWIQGEQGHILDPVAAWERHKAINRPSLISAAFSYRQDGVIRVSCVTHEHLVNAAKFMARLVGVDPDSVSGHSFRRGGASYAALAGVPDILIQRQGDWKSACYRAYIVCPPETHLKATQSMLSTMVGDPTTWGAGLLPAVSPLDHTGLQVLDDV